MTKTAKEVRTALVNLLPSRFEPCEVSEVSQQDCDLVRSTTRDYLPGFQIPKKNYSLTWAEEVLHLLKSVIALDDTELLEASKKPVTAAQIREEIEKIKSDKCNPQLAIRGLVNIFPKLKELSYVGLNP